MTNRIWENLPDKFKLGDDPEEHLTVWRGARVGREITGMHCKLDQSIDPEEVVYKSLSEYPKLHTLMKRHSNFSSESPLLSLTKDIEVAQSFACDADETVYEIILPVSSLLTYPRHPKYPDHEGPEAEIFAVGKIEPSEIVAVQIDGGWDRSMSWVAR